MPFYTQRKRKTFRRRSFKPKSTKQVAWRAWKTAKATRKRMNQSIEKKFIDTVFAPTVITSAGTIQQLDATQQGADDNDQRVGDIIWVKSLFTRLSVVVNPTATQNFIRVIIFKDKQQNGTVAGVTDLLQSASYTSQLNRDYSLRFKVIIDRTYCVDDAGSALQIDKLYKKLFYKAEYQTASLVPRTNGLNMLLISDQATNGPTVQFNNRVRFIDP